MFAESKVVAFFKSNARLSNARSANCSQKWNFAWFQFHEVKISGSRSVLRESQGIRSQFPRDPWTHFYNAHLQFHVFCLEKKCFFKQYPKVFNGRYVYFLCRLEYIVKALSLPMKQTTVILIEVKSCNGLLYVLLLCISIYPKSVLGYIYFNFGCLSSGHFIFTLAWIWA